jgi:hypothetical protein
MQRYNFRHTHTHTLTRTHTHSASELSGTEVNSTPGYNGIHTLVRIEFRHP